MEANILVATAMSRKRSAESYFRSLLPVEAFPLCNVMVLEEKTRYILRSIKQRGKTDIQEKKKKGEIAGGL